MKDEVFFRPEPAKPEPRIKGMQELVLDAFIGMVRENELALGDEVTRLQSVISSIEQKHEQDLADLERRNFLIKTNSEQHNADKIKTLETTIVYWKGEHARAAAIAQGRANNDHLVRDAYYAAAQYVFMIQKGVMMMEKGRPRPATPAEKRKAFKKMEEALRAAADFIVSLS